MTKKKIGLLLLILFGVAYFGHKYIENTKGKVAASAMPMDVIEVQEQDFYPTLSFVSKIEAKDKVAARARVSGFLTKRLFLEGDYVTEGQLLFEIEKDQFEANVRAAEAALSKARAALQNATAQYKRAQDLIKTKDISVATLDARQADYNSAEALVKQAESELDVAQLNLNYTDIKSPLTGRIGESRYSVGSFIGPESGELASIVTTTPMYGVFSVSENELNKLRGFLKDEKALDIVFQYADGSSYPHHGRLNFVDTGLDTQMNTLKMRVSLPNPDNELIAGQYGRMNMTFTTPQRAFLLSQKVVQQDLSGSFVYVVGEDNKLAQRRIKEGLELANGDVIVEDGLVAGDKVLINNFQKAARMIGVPVSPVIQQKTHKEQKI